MELSLENIAVSASILPGFKIRSETIDPEENKAFVQSIKENGILQSILVRRIIGNKFEVVAGVRRYQAARQLGIKKIPAIVMEHMTDTEVRLYRLIENVQRKDLSLIEKANAIGAMYQTHAFNLEQTMSYLEKMHHGAKYAKEVPEIFKKLMNRTGYAAHHQRRILRVLELSEPIQDKIAKFDLKVEQAELLTHKDILKEKDPEIKEYVQDKLIEKIKYSPLSIARQAVKQEGYNIRSGIVYKKSPTDGSVVYNPHNVEHIPVSDEIMEDVRSKKYLRTLFELENAMSEFVTAGTGESEHGMADAYVRNTKNYRLELVKKIGERDALRLYNGMFTVKALADNFLEILDEAVQSREKKDKLLTT
jgi:ParB-like chromosome segregation protein Spo0J